MLELGRESKTVQQPQLTNIREKGVERDRVCFCRQKSRGVTQTGKGLKIV